MGLYNCFNDTYTCISLFHFHLHFLNAATSLISVAVFKMECYIFASGQQKRFLHYSYQWLLPSMLSKMLCMVSYLYLGSCLLLWSLVNNSQPKFMVESMWSEGSEWRLCRFNVGPLGLVIFSSGTCCVIQQLWVWTWCTPAKIVYLQLFLSLSNKFDTGISWYWILKLSTAVYRAKE